jgi:FlaA1/EpsC-like NDP-sugar epimerase
MTKSKQMLLIKLGIDILLGALAAYCAFALRIGLPLGKYAPRAFTYTYISVFIKVALNYYFNLHRQSWRTVGTRDALALAKSTVTFALIASSIAFMLGHNYNIPRSIPLIDALVYAVFLGSSRFASRIIFEEIVGRKTGINKKRTLIVGAGDAGTMIAREIFRHPESGLVPVGFLDDDPSKKETRFLGLDVFGPIGDLRQVVRGHSIEEVIIAMPSAPGTTVRRIVELAKKAKVQYRIIPGIYEVISGKVSISLLRPVDVEDLLRREPVRLDIDSIAGYLSSKVVLVTGAGGSIGSEICRQICHFSPKLLILLGRGENSLFNIEREMKANYSHIPYVTMVADVRNTHKIEHIFEQYRPEVVFHAAAHKHVPMMETNPDEAILNNIGGTQNLVKNALRFNTSYFVNISTDKAVNPTSIMGASKRVAEMVVRKAAKEAREGQHFMSVRFGNVLGSRGSVVPIFRDQIRKGGPVTVTHPDMTRYFMTIPEAAQLVLQAGGMQKNGQVFVLDMGDPVKIVDLAKDLIRLSGFEPGEDIDIVYTGVRPGEKLFEELLTAEEGTTATHHKKIFEAKSNDLPADLDAKLAGLFETAASGNNEDICKRLFEVVPQFKSKEIEGAVHEQI